MTQIYVKQNTLTCEGVQYECAIGKAGFSTNKIEGDNCTPVGTFKIRRVFYRADKITLPDNIQIFSIPITPDMGWSDDSTDVNYNRLVSLPHAYRAEKMYRDDDVYDVVIELGYNDDPVIMGKGSAVFFHIARDGYLGTEGCVAITLEHMLKVLPIIDSNSVMYITQ